MATPALVPGVKFRLYRKVGGSPVFMGMGKTLSFKRNNQFDSSVVPDEAAPTDTPWQYSVPKGRSWSLSFSGALDVSKLANLQADIDAETPVAYEIALDDANASGGGKYDGNIWFDDFSVDKNDNGMVSYTATCHGDGKAAWTAAT